MTKSQKGGKILGQGRDGCVTSPPYMCTKKLDTNTHVSKLIDLKQVDQSKVIEEYRLGQVLLKADPAHKYFLPYVDMCKYTIDEKLLAGKPNLQSKYYDMQKCGFSHKNIIDVSSLILPKGQPFELRGSSMNDKLKAVYHCAKIINKLSKMRMVHFDIKQDNMLMYNGHPALIDFTPDFVFPATKENFEEFSDWFGRQFYFAWPREMFQITHVIRNDMYRKKIDDISFLDKNLPKEYIKEFRQSMYNTKEFKYYDYIYDKHFNLFCDKMMMYSIGSALREACDGIYPQIIDSMLDDYDMRPSSAEVIDIMKGYFSKSKKNVSVKVGKDTVIDVKTSVKPSKKRSPKLSKKAKQTPTSPSKKSIKKRVKVKYQKTPAIVAKVQKLPSIPKTPALPTNLVLSALPKTPAFIAKSNKKLLTPADLPKGQRQLTSLDDMPKKDLVALIKKYKIENCPPISGLSIMQIKKQITKYDSSIVIGSKTKKELSAILKKQKDARCKDIKSTGSKGVLIKQILKHKITK